MTKITINERMVKIETTLNFLREEITKTNDLIKTYIIKHEETHNILNAKVDNLDNKYASKKIEQASYWVLGTLFSTLLGIIIFLLTRGIK